MSVRQQAAVRAGSSAFSFEKGVAPGPGQDFPHASGGLALHFKITLTRLSSFSWLSVGASSFPSKKITSELLLGDLFCWIYSKQTVPPTLVGDKGPKLVSGQAHCASCSARMCSVLHHPRAPGLRSPCLSMTWCPPPARSLSHLAPAPPSSRPPAPSPCPRAHRCRHGGQVTP